MRLSSVESNDVTGFPDQETPANVEDNADDGDEPIVTRGLAPSRLGSYAVRPRRAATDGE